MFARDKSLLTTKFDIDTTRILYHVHKTLCESQFINVISMQRLCCMECESANVFHFNLILLLGFALTFRRIVAQQNQEQTRISSNFIWLFKMKVYGKLFCLKKGFMMKEARRWCDSC